nr:Chain E, 12-MER PEPTIDE [synthetic construct]1DKD_F Chain F, 12-MER PEPTIDE [synthetic construct]1DKD_G Chain G, 12-MER PEPTIDE [synthetic construct]1DKD_H Chain H, 12-MER PEPTIDE [synthetic construct]1MNF_1 Chain 1, 12-residue peptide substrate1MNF_2 Chain 2, 12-residue peptide substrate1MNF_O Chain O, 12-residue peptide substrate1MNF_P Chain P, 12-residue peptide substrate1MNF_Q Chain Q, 12-residue peptide substrate1MNF_R Chain R, 12-residue peptide substrate1MNF_S Chain S, 12-residu
SWMTTPWGFLHP